MLEVVGDFTGKKICPTFFQGSKLIDGKWATPNLVVTHACIIPSGYGVGDHWLFVVDFQEGSLIGEAPFQIKRFTSQRLNTKMSSSATQKISFKAGEQSRSSSSHRTSWATSHHS
jgi:hypothetical protein